VRQVKNLKEIMSTQGTTSKGEGGKNHKKARTTNNGLVPDLLDVVLKATDEDYRVLTCNADIHMRVATCRR